MLFHGAANYRLWLMPMGAWMFSSEWLFGVWPDLLLAHSWMMLVYVFGIRLLIVTTGAANLLIGLLEYALVALNLLLEILLEGGHAAILDMHFSDDGWWRIVRFHAHRGRHWGVRSDMVLLLLFALRAPTWVLSMSSNVLFRHVLILVVRRRMCYFIAWGTARTCRLLVDRAWRSNESAWLCLRDLLGVLRVVS